MREWVCFWFFVFWRFWIVGEVLATILRRNPVMDGRGRETIDCQRIFRLIYLRWR